MMLLLRSAVFLTLLLIAGCSAQERAPKIEKMEKVGPSEQTYINGRPAFIMVGAIHPDDTPESAATREMETKCPAGKPELYSVKAMQASEGQQLFTAIYTCDK